MGGGMGLMNGCNFRVVTETSRLAMPETAIGLFPDVGASLFLGRCPTPVARLLGMHGHRLGAADCLLLGLATAQVPSTSLVALREKLLACDVADIGSVIRQFQTDAGQPPLAAQRRLIDHIFADGPVEYMRDRAANLAENMPENQFLGGVAAGFATRCPLSIKLFDRLLAETADETDPVAAIELDFHLALRMTKHADFIEGVRAIVIDKDQAPQWTPNSLEAVNETMLDAVFDRAGLPALF